jgi:hypothetical protein
VKNPSEFTAKVVLPWEQDAYEKASQQWQVDMDAVEEKTIVNSDVRKVGLLLLQPEIRTPLNRDACDLSRVCSCFMFHYDYYYHYLL